MICKLNVQTSWKERDYNKKQHAHLFCRNFNCLSFVCRRRICYISIRWTFSRTSRSDSRFSFEWIHLSSEEVLPDEKEDTKLGENHLSLINAILNIKDYGLNETKKPILHTYLADDGIIYCDQNVKGGNLKHLMIDQVNGSERLYFVITKVSDRFIIPIQCVITIFPIPSEHAFRFSEQLWKKRAENGPQRVV